MDIKYIAEGETEATFIEQMQLMNNIPAGRKYKFNLMQAKLKQTNDILTKKCDRIYCVIDTDVAENINLINLQYNLKAISKICKSIIVLAQWHNFEDELRYMANKSNLSVVFVQKFQGNADLKKYLHQTVDYSKYQQSLLFTRYCNRSNKLIEIATQNGISFSKKIRFENSFIK